jgi:hypothetical protein
MKSIVGVHAEGENPTGLVNSKTGKGICVAAGGYECRQLRSFAVIVYICFT